MKRALVLFLCLFHSGALQAAQESFSHVSDVTDVVAVEVPVQVLRDGEPVRGLTSADFEIYEGRKRYDVTGFEVLDLASPDARPRSVPAAARRHFLLFFDLSFSEPKAILAARDAAKDLLDGLHPSDLVAVAVYAGSKGAQLVLRFTSDRPQIRAAIDSLGAPELMDRSNDPLRLVVSDELVADEQNRFLSFDRASEGRAEAQRGKADALANFLQVVAGESDKVERSARQKTVAALTRSVGELARMLGAIEGRKHVVYLSEGFDSSLLQGTSSLEEQERMNESSHFGEIWNVDSESRYGSTRSVNDVERMLEELRRADCVVEAVDIGGLKAGSSPGVRAGRDSLFMIARGTGGELHENSNDLSAAMDEMLDRTSVTYVLTYQPDDVKRDGAWRKLRVELKETVKGARVVHRPGYYAPRPYAERSAPEKLLETAHLVVNGIESSEIPAAVLAAPFRTEGAAEAYVPVLIEVDGGKLVGGARSGTLPAELYVYAMDQAGAVRGHVTQTVALDLAKVGPALRQSGLKFFGHLDLPPGDYSLRVLVRNGLTGNTGMKVVPVKVPAFAQGPRVLLPPFFPEPTGKWLVVREATRPDTRQKSRQVPYPFMIGEEPYIPASLPVLRDGETARLSLVGYNLGAGEPRIEARVLTPDGREVGPAAVELVRREAGGPAAPDRLLASFRPRGLQPGEYLLVITLGPATTTTPFVVANLP